MTIAEAQCNEMLDVSRVLLDMVRGIEDAVGRLIRLVGDLISPASPDPNRKEEP